MNLRKALPVAIILLAMSAGGLPAQTLTMPEMTPQQRWNRAALHVTLFSVVILKQQMSQGKSATDVGHDLATVFGPGWSNIKTPEAMARAINTNWMLWPATELNAQQGADGTVTIRVNRPYRAAFGESGSLLGVSMQDFESMFHTFHEQVAAQQGLTYQHNDDGDYVVLKIGKASQ